MMSRDANHYMKLAHVQTIQEKVNKKVHFFESQTDEDKLHHSKYDELRGKMIGELTGALETKE
jgi:hypothetical protein